MEDESGTDGRVDASGDGGGGQTVESLCLTEADSGISLSSKSCEESEAGNIKVEQDCGETFDKTSAIVTKVNGETDTASDADAKLNQSSASSDDVEMSPRDDGVAAFDSERPNKKVRLTPPGDTEYRSSNGLNIQDDNKNSVDDADKMSVDNDDDEQADGILTLDQSVEECVVDPLVDDDPSLVKLSTVLGPVQGPSLPKTSASKTNSSDESHSSEDGCGSLDGAARGGVCKSGKQSTKKKHTKSNGDAKRHKRNSACSSGTATNSKSNGDCSKGSDSETASATNRQDGVEVVPPHELPELSSDSDDDEDTLESDDEGEGAGVVNPDLLTPSQRRVLQRRRLRGRFKRHLRRVSSSSDSDDGSDNITDEEPRSDMKLSSQESDNEEDVKRIVQEVLEKTQPRPNWFALREVRKREYSASAKFNPGWFREGVQGSLQMVKRMKVVQKLKGHEGCVNALCFNRIGTLLASGSDDLDIVLWNWQKGRPSASYFSGHRSNVFQAKFMPFSGDCHVISCARDGQVRIAELNSSGVCKETRKLAQHRGAAHKLALEYDSAHIFLSCGEDALTYLFDLRQEKPHKLVTAKENEKKVPLYSIHSNPSDSNQFCVGGRDHYIRVFDKRKIAEQADGGVLKKLCPHHLETTDLKANVTCACYNYNGSEILGSYNDEDIYLFDNTMSDGANYVHKYTGHRNNATVKGVNFYGPRSEFVISGSDCGNVYFWDKETEAIVNFQPGDITGVINVVEPHPNLPVLATAGLDHNVKVWMPTLSEPCLDKDELKKVIKKNQVERNIERVTSEPEFGGQMLWFIMHHFQNSIRRRMRNEENADVSNSDEDDDEEVEGNSDDSDSNRMQCAQS